MSHRKNIDDDALIHKILEYIPSEFELETGESDSYEISVLQRHGMYVSYNGGILSLLQNRIQNS